MTERVVAADGAGQGSAWKKVLLTTVQVGITLTVLFLVFRDPAKRAEMVGVIAGANPWWLLAGFVMAGIVELIAGVRWHMLLRVQGIVLARGRLLALLLIGVFFNFFIPGGTGGDVAKIFYLLKETPGQRATALLSVFVDRLIGVLALAFVAGFFAVTRWEWLVSSPETARYVWPVFIVLGSTFGGLHFTIIVTRHHLIHKLPAWMPGREKLAELAGAYHLYGKAWRTTLATFFLSAAAHVAYFVVFYCAAKSFHLAGMRIPTFGELCAIMPIVNTITVLPISLGGIGVREGLFEVFLGQLCQVNAAVAVMISSVGYLLTLGWGLVGGVIYMFYRPSEHARLREIQAQVRALEHEVAEEEIAHEAAEERK